MKRLQARRLLFPVAGPDEDAAAAASADTSTTAETPPAGTSEAEKTSADDTKFDAEYVKKLRSENAARRKREAELEAQLKAHEDAKLSDQEKRAKELQTAQDELNHLRYKARMGELIDAAVKHGAAHPSAVARLIDDGEDDIDAAVARVKKEIPALFKPAVTGSADGGNQGKNATAQDMNAILKAALNRTVVSG